MASGPPAAAGQPGGAGRVRYASEVTAVGELAGSFAEQGILVFFGESAPPELHDFSVLHRAAVTAGGITPGDQVVIDDTVLRVLAVGELADQNLVSLGHLNLKANGETQPQLPGDVCVESVELPLPRPGSKLWIQAR